MPKTVLYRKLCNLSSVVVQVSVVPLLLAYATTNNLKIFEHKGSNTLQGSFKGSQDKSSGFSLWSQGHPDSFFHHATSLDAPSRR